MSKDQLQAQVSALIGNKAKGLEPMLKAFAQSRFLVAASEYGENEKELDALNMISEAIQCTVVSTGSGVSLEIDFDDGDKGNYLEIIQDGMSAPLTGGTNGTVRNPDGSVQRSAVPEQLWGNPIEEYAESGSDVLEDVKALLKDLFTSNVRDLVSQSRKEISSIAKDAVMQELRKALKR